MKRLATLTLHLAHLRDRLKRAWQLARFGPITETVRSVDGGLASEVEYRGRNGKIIGYWAYGYYDPGMPYQG